MPNHRMNSGTSARKGRVRSICIGASTTSSPRRDRPATSARATPAERPMARPAPTRPSETSRCDGSSPDSVSSQALARMVLGAARVRGAISPAIEAACHSRMIASGERKRRSCGGSARRGRNGRCAGAAIRACGSLAAWVSDMLVLRGARAACGLEGSGRAGKPRRRAGSGPTAARHSAGDGMALRHRPQKYEAGGRRERVVIPKLRRPGRMPVLPKPRAAENYSRAASAMRSRKAVPPSG